MGGVYDKSEFQQTVPEEPQAETCFHQALSIARRQQAKSWELRESCKLACRPVLDSTPFVTVCST
jgi:hypothetical protein